MVRLSSSTASPNRGQKHAGNEVGRHGHGNEVQREVQHGGPGGAGHQVHDAAPRILAREQPLPQHVEAGRAHAQQRTARGRQGHGARVQIQGSDEQAPAGHVGHGDGLHEEAAGLGGEEVGAHGARQKREREGERLGSEEPQHHRRRLEAHGQKREHAAPHAGRVDGQKQSVANRGHVGPQQLQHRAQVHASLPSRRAQYTVPGGLLSPPKSAPSASVHGAGAGDTIGKCESVIGLNWGNVKITRSV